MVLRRSGIRIRPSILLTASNHFVYGTFLCILFFFFFLPLALHYLRTRTHIQTRGFGGGRWLERERKKTTRKPNQMGKKNKNTAAILGRLLHHRPRTVSVSLIRRFICSFSFKKKCFFFFSWYLFAFLVVLSRLSSLSWLFHPKFTWWYPVLFSNFLSPMSRVLVIIFQIQSIS